jgi:hypothetical protein
MSAEEHLINDIDTLSCPPEISEEIRKKMVETDTIVSIHFYPDTPISFFDIYHYDLDTCLDLALECLEDN